MILLRSKEGTKFQILVEIAAHQPNIRQKEIADKIGVTPQAVSEYVKELVSEGLLSSLGRVRYKVTREGIEWVLTHATDLKKYTRFVMEDIVSHVAVWTAIAEEDVEKKQEVFLEMKNGLLYASPEAKNTACGITISSAKKNEDVGVTDLKGIIGLEQVNITICKVPRVERGGSRNVNLEYLKRLAVTKPYIVAIGVEALIALKKADIDPDVFFGAKESVVEAAFHGLSSLIVSIDDEIHSLLNRLEDEGLNYEVIDLRK